MVNEDELLRELLARKAEREKSKPKKLTLTALAVYLVSGALIVTTLVLVTFQAFTGVNLMHMAADYKAAVEQDAAAPLQAAQQAAQGAAQRIRTVVQQQYAPPAEADAPALRQPKPGVEWDGKSIKAGKVVEEPKVQPVEQPKYGKAIPTAAPLVAQPVKPPPPKPKAQPTTKKVERQGKAVGP